MTLLRSLLLLLITAIAGSTADSEIDELLQKTRTKVLENAHRIPRYTCVETVSRAQYQAPPNSPASCPALIAGRHQGAATGPLLVRDRLRLDVAIVNGGEMFSWAGAGKFETHDVDQLVGRGASGSGDFSAFLESVFSLTPDSFRYQGLRNDLAVFAYTVPLAKSTYLYRGDTGVTEKRTGFHGTFSVDPDDGDLEQLALETDPFDAGDRACLIDHVMNYQRLKIGGGDFLLPEVSTMKVLYPSGGESVNETHYSECREYVGESTIRFDDVDTSASAAAAKPKIPPLAPDTRLQIALTGTIDGEAAAAGDELIGLATVGREKDRVTGRIFRLAQIMAPKPHWVLAIHFDTIERGGASQPLALKPIDGKAPSPFPDIPADAGVFIFQAPGNLVLDRKFHSVWETR